MGGRRNGNGGGNHWTTTWMMMIVVMTMMRVMCLHLVRGFDLSIPHSRLPLTPLLLA